jgi:hypothetical protein
VSVLDPACGDGELLLAALEAAGGDPDFARRGLFGIELRPDLADRARERLRRAAGLPPGTELERHVVAADALAPAASWPAGTWVLANPPWISYSGREAGPRDSRAEDKLGPGTGWPSLHGAFLERIAEHVAAEGTGARVLLPAALTELEGYAALRRTVGERVHLPHPAEELGEAFEGVVGEVVLLTLAPGAGGDERAWSPGQDRAAEWVRRLERFPRLPERTFRDPGVHSGNAAAELIVRAAERSADLAPIREGRCLLPFDLGPAQALVRTDLEPTAERRFRLRHQAHYASFPVLLRQTADRPMAALHTSPTYFRNSLLAAREVAGLDPAFVVAILNGPVAAAWHRARFRDARQRTFPQVKVSHLRTLPFPIADREQAPALHDELARRVRVLRPESADFERARAEVERLALEAYGLGGELEELVLTRSAAR